MGSGLVIDMKHPSLIEWEKQLKKIFDLVDDMLEEKYGALYTLHPSRAKIGSTSNKEHDGLFNVGSSFSAGFGSTLGRGYVIDIDMVTLEKVPKEITGKIEKDVVKMVKELLPVHFPERELDVKHDGNVFKIVGDFSLGSV